MTTTGSCNCGKISWRAEGDLREITACHCSQCRKQTGHYYAATMVADANLTIMGEENLTWYAASATARRGFCKHCGSALFWKGNGEDHTSMMAGAIDGESGLKITRHIFVADKGDYYELDEGIPQYEQTPGN